MKNKLVVFGVGLFVLALVATAFLFLRSLQPNGFDQKRGLETGGDTVTTDSVSQLSEPADWGGFVSLLKLEVMSDNDRQQLESQIARLTPSEAWANQMLVDRMNEQTALAYSLRPLLVRGLGNLGSSAQSAIPTILDSVMSRTSIRMDMVALATAALKQIDPTAEQIIPELAAFEARQGGSENARYISQEILKAYDTQAAKEALERYTSAKE